MKTSIDYLPKVKQKALLTIVDIICKTYPDIEMIILFGSYARGDWVEELSEDGFRFKYQSDFDIFVVTESKKLASKIDGDSDLDSRIDRIVKTPTTIIAHDIDFLNRRLRKGQYFFTDIKKEGICLYDSGQFQLAEPKELSPKERKNLAKEDFEYYFDSANEFMVDFKNAFNRGSYSKAAFELHQVTERLYSALLLVFTRYKPNTHDLKKLSKRVAGQAPEFLTIFPQGTEEEKRCFELLRKAYVDARYKKTYVITKEELTWLEKQVIKLRDLTKELCQKKIESFLST